MCGPVRGNPVPVLSMREKGCLLCSQPATRFGCSEDKSARVNKFWLSIKKKNTPPRAAINPTLYSSRFRTLVEKLGRQRQPQAAPQTDQIYICMIQVSSSSFEQLVASS